MPNMGMGMGMGGMGGMGPVSNSLFNVSRIPPLRPPADDVSTHRSHTPLLPPPPPSLPPRPDFIPVSPSAPQHPQHYHRREAGKRARRSGGNRLPSRGPPTFRVLTDCSTIVTSPAYGSSVPSTGNFGQGSYNSAFFNQGQGGGNCTNPHGNKRQRQNE